MRAGCLLLIISVLVHSWAYTLDDDDKKHGCSRHTDKGTKTICYGTMYKQGLISDTELGAGLQEVEDMLPSESSYYSVGYEYGPENYLTFGVQDHYHFRSKSRVPLRMRFWKDKPTYLAPLGKEKRMIVYASESDADIPIYERDALEEGYKSLYRLYAMSGWKSSTNTTDCDGLKNTDEVKRLEKMDYVALVVPGKYWCSELKGFSVMKGKLQARKTKDDFEYMALRGDFP